MSEESRLEIKDVLDNWNKMLSFLEMGGNVSHVFLELCKGDLKFTLNKIKCPYCRKQMEVEYKLLTHALSLANLSSGWLGSKGVKIKLKIICKAIVTIAKITLLHISKIF